MTFYRVEQLESPRIQRAERRHLAGLNYPAVRADRAQGGVLPRLPLERSFISSEEERKPFNGFATAAVFFF